MKLYILTHNIVAIFTKINEKSDKKRTAKALKKPYKKTKNVIGAKVPRLIK